MKIFDTVLTHLGDSLDVRLVEHNVLAGNVANADTPGYKPKELSFSAAMAAAETNVDPTMMAETNASHLAANGTVAGEAASRATSLATSLVGDGGGLSPSFDGNAVDVDRTMAGLAENALQYGAVAKAAQKKLAILHYVASDGGS